MSELDTLNIKSLVREAVSETLISNKELIYSVFYEALEDFYLSQAIREGESSGLASRKEVFDLLEAV